MDRPLLILSDTHLSRDYGGPVAHDLARLLEQNSHAEVILNGDILDLSLDPADRNPAESLHSALAPHGAFVGALSQHVTQGGKLTLVPGNHDAGLTAAEQQESLRRTLRAPNDECVEVSSWFIRRGDVHIEHGHLYDPDCAPNHPLADANAHSEGLGTALMRRFVSPNDAIVFAHANQVTPASGLKQAFDKWGFYAPVVIANYFRTAFTLCFEAVAHKQSVAVEKHQGSARLDAYAQQNAYESETLQALIDLAPVPTHHHFSSTFLRLYFDRILAGSSLATGMALLGASGLSLGAATLGVAPLVTAGGELTATGALLSLAGGGYLTQNISRNKNRYGDKVIGQLGEAAQGIRQVTGSQLVVMGHTHVEVDEPDYVNLGSFGFGQKRPYLYVATDGTHERRYLGEK